MNLAAKEYVAAQDPSDPGALVLSRFAGAANELTDAILVNPTISMHWLKVFSRRSSFREPSGYCVGVA